MRDLDSLRRRRVCACARNDATRNEGNYLFSLVVVVSVAPAAMPASTAAASVAGTHLALYSHVPVRRVDCCADLALLV